MGSLKGILVSIFLSLVITASVSTLDACANANSKEVDYDVTPGAACTEHGDTGHDALGKKYKCSRSKLDHKWRWAPV